MHKKFLITGSSGFIGSNFISMLDSDKENYWAIDHKKSFYKNIKNFSQIDLNNNKKLNDFFNNKKFDYVVNFVALSGIIDCDINPEKAIHDNLITTLNILKNEKNFKKIILISSYSTLDEESFSIYSGCKKIIEQFPNASLAKNKIITIRIPNIYGKFSLHKKSLIAQICKSVIKNKIFNIHGTGKQERNYVYVNDLCKIIKNICLKKSPKKNKLINIGNKKNYSINKIIKFFEKIKKKKILTKNIKHPLDAKFTKTKSIVKNLDYLTKDKSFQKNLRETLDWYKSY